MQLTKPIIMNESIMNHHWLISRFQSPIIHCGSIMNHQWLISRFQSPIVHCGSIMNQSSIITPKSMMISHQSLRIINYYTQINDDQAQPITTRASIISQNNITISQKM
jgi:hypothetical protein